MIKHARPYLVLIRDALDHISKYQPASLEALQNDELRQDAIAMRLQEVGENLASIRDATPDYYASNADETWQRVIGLRNIISHGYHVIRQEQIWDIMINHLPALSERIDQLLESAED